MGYGPTNYANNLQQQVNNSFQQQRQRMMNPALTGVSSDQQLSALQLAGLAPGGTVLGDNRRIAGISMDYLGLPRNPMDPNSIIANFDRNYGQNIFSYATALGGPNSLASQLDRSYREALAKQQGRPPFMPMPGGMQGGFPQQGFPGGFPPQGLPPGYGFPQQGLQGGFPPQGAFPQQAGFMQPGFAPGQQVPNPFGQTGNNINALPQASNPFQQVQAGGQIPGQIGQVQGIAGAVGAAAAGAVGAAGAMDPMTIIILFLVLAQLTKGKKEPPIPFEGFELDKILKAINVQVPVDAKDREKFDVIIINEHKLDALMTRLAIDPEDYIELENKINAVFERETIVDTYLTEFGFNPQNYLYDIAGKLGALETKQNQINFLYANIESDPPANINLMGKLDKLAESKEELRELAALVELDPPENAKLPEFYTALFNKSLELNGWLSEFGLPAPAANATIQDKLTSLESARAEMDYLLVNLGLDPDDYDSIYKAARAVIQKEADINALLIKAQLQPGNYQTIADKYDALVNKELEIDSSGLLDDYGMDVSDDASLADKLTMIKQGRTEIEFLFLNLGLDPADFDGDLDIFSEILIYGDEIDQLLEETAGLDDEPVPPNATLRDKFNILKARDEMLTEILESLDEDPAEYPTIKDKLEFLEELAEELPEDEPEF